MSIPCKDIGSTMSGGESDDKCEHGSKLLICMVGLSGCGKTYFFYFVRHMYRFVAHRIRKFLTWKGYNAKVITCADTRLKYFPELASPSPNFFSDNNEQV